MWNTCARWVVTRIAFIKWQPLRRRHERVRKGMKANDLLEKHRCKGWTRAWGYCGHVAPTCRTQKKRGKSFGWQALISTKAKPLWSMFFCSFFIFLHHEMWQRPIQHKNSHVSMYWCSCLLVTFFYWQSFFWCAVALSVGRSVGWSSCLSEKLQKMFEIT